MADLSEIKQCFLFVKELDECINLIDAALDKSIMKKADLETLALLRNQCDMLRHTVREVELLGASDAPKFAQTVAGLPKFTHLIKSHLTKV